MSEEINKFNVGDYIVINEKPQILRRPSGLYETIPHELSGKVWQIKACKYPNMVLDLIHSDDMLIRQSINKEELSEEINKVDKDYADLMKESVTLDSIIGETLRHSFEAQDTTQFNSEFISRMQGDVSEGEWHHSGSDQDMDQDMDLEE